MCFSSPWHPSAFDLLISSFLVTYWSDLSNLLKNTTTGSWTIMLQVFGPQKSFSVSYKWKRNSISWFFGKQRLFIESCFYSKLGSATVFALIDGTHFNWEACFICFARLLSGQFFSRNRKFWFFAKYWTSPFPIAFPNFGAHFLRTQF